MQEKNAQAAICAVYSDESLFKNTICTVQPTQDGFFRFVTESGDTCLFAPELFERLDEKDMTHALLCPVCEKYVFERRSEHDYCRVCYRFVTDKPDRSEEELRRDREEYLKEHPTRTEPTGTKMIYIGPNLYENAVCTVQPTQDGFYSFTTESGSIRLFAEDLFEPLDEIDLTVEHLCPVCEKYVFECEGSFDICEVCGWEDDDYQFRYPDYSGGANAMSVNQAREAYKNGRPIL